jgi:hypothetical protein
MVLAPRIKNYIYLRGLDLQYPNVYKSLCYLLDIIYSLSLAICTGYIVNSIILPLVNKLMICLKNVFNGILYMSGGDKGNPEIGGSDRKNPSPDPQKPSDVGLSNADKKKKKKLKKIQSNHIPIRRIMITFLKLLKVFKNTKSTLIGYLIWTIYWKNIVCIYLKVIR